MNYFTRFEMKTRCFLLLIFLLIAFFNKGFSQKPSREIPKPVQQEIVRFFMEVVYDTTLKVKDRKTPVLVEKATSMEYHYKPVNDADPCGSIDIPKTVVTGDMDGDGAEEMIVTPVANYCGSASFGYIFLFKPVNGHWKYMTYFDQMDRFLENVEIVEGILQGTIMDYDINDPHCCPTLLTKIRYRYDRLKNELIEVEREVTQKITR